jgi:hypothetical protein
VPVRCRTLASGGPESGCRCLSGQGPLLGALLERWCEETCHCHRYGLHTLVDTQAGIDVPLSSTGLLKLKLQELSPAFSRFQLLLPRLFLSLGVCKLLLQIGCLPLLRVEMCLQVSNLPLLMRNVLVGCGSSRGCELHLQFRHFKLTLVRLSFGCSGCIGRRKLACSSRCPAHKSIVRELENSKHRVNCGRVSRHGSEVQQGDP